jgi:transposase-like protein
VVGLLRCYILDTVDAPITVADELATEQQCLDFAQRLRWPGGVQCVQCGSTRVARLLVQETTRKVRRKNGEVETVPVPSRHLYQCADCGRQFTVTAGTLFHDTHLPLTKWFMAIALMVNAKGTLTARQMQRDLRVSYKTAWYLHHRIRDALRGSPNG